ncbi:hypothetical protein AMATHDRAFT_120171, partial [Amanita thiersii Skay4041]
LFYVALAVKPASLRRLFFPPIAIINLYLISSRNEDVFGFAVTYFSKCSLATNIFVASDYLLLTDVQTEFCTKKQDTPVWSRTFFERLKWGFLVVHSPRGIGWTHDTRNGAPRAQGYHRENSITRFTINQVMRLACYLALLIGVGDTWNTWFYKNYPPVRSQPWSFRPISVLGWTIPIFLSLDGSHRLLNLILIHLRCLEPQDWVPLFGSWREGYTIRNFWGRVWHQLTRRFTLAHGEFVALRVLRFQRRTFLFYAVRVFVAFLSSAVIHAAADYVLFGECRGTFQFFLLQVLAIIVETIVLRAASQSFLVHSLGFVPWKLVGYIWVLSWFSYSLPFWT